MWTFTWKSLIYFDLIMFVRWKNEIIQYLGQSRPHKFKLRPLEDILRHLKDVQTPRLNIMEHLEAKRGQILDYNSLLGPKDNWSCCAESVGCINRNLFSLIILLDIDIDGAFRLYCVYILSMFVYVLWKLTDADDTTFSTAAMFVVSKSWLLHRSLGQLQLVAEMNK